MKCEFCGKEYSIKGIGSHVWRNHGQGVDWSPTPKGKPPWNKGLSKETDDRVKRESQKVSESLKGKKRNPLSKSHRIKIALSMKKAHASGIAWNIGKSRWNNKPSYPEVFFMRVISNEFEDKNYQREYSFHRFSLDFAWIHKKKCIEIDGNQHDKFIEQKERDIQKEKLLNEDGWQCLRIKWKDIYKDTKHWICIAKDFIDPL
jgi:very-short-patch-repair endonuclease